ncbi:MAG: hypothetical protein IT204_23155 [Fimbriimonadaceae bacterium]|nr:hypothetical protein [Fimbriimonadaceae bacterium]
MSNERIALWPLLLAGLLAASSGWQRIGTERANGAVCLVVDYGEVLALARYANQPPAALFAELRAAGVRGVAIEEPQVEDLVQAGLLRASATSQGVLLSGTAGWALAAVARQYQLPRSDPLFVPVGWANLKLAGGGLDPAAAEAVRLAGLAPVARLRNNSGLDAATLGAALDSVVALGARQVIFAGDEALGYRGLLPATAQALVARGLVWGRVEFSQQKGEQRLAEELLQPPLNASYARVHSITEGEMAKLAPALCVERFRRAAVERNIRICFVRLILDPDPQILATNTRFVGDIAGALTRAGLTLGTATPFPRFTVHLRRLLVGLLGSVAAAAWLLTILRGPFQRRRWAATWLLGAALGLLLWLLSDSLFAKLAALGGGTAVLLLAARWVWYRLSVAPPQSLGGACAVLLGGVGWALLGAAQPVGLLSATPYLLSHAIFSGVKLTQAVPLLAGGLLLATGWTLPGVDLATARQRLRQWWQQPVLTAHVVLAGVGLVLLLVLLVRSGNEGVEISETELRLRALLENVFGARPRTKEMLLGHPALLLAALAAWRGRRHWLPVLYLGGLVGLVSTFNTFCHLHTPLTQSLLRTFHAVWIGALLALLAGGALGLLRRRS